MRHEERGIRPVGGILAAEREAIGVGVAIAVGVVVYELGKGFLVFLNRFAAVS